MLEVNNYSVTDFEGILGLWGNHIPEDLKSAYVYVYDTLFICNAIASEKLPHDPTNEDVLAIYKMVMDRIKEQERSGNI